MTEEMLEDNGDKYAKNGLESCLKISKNLISSLYPTEMEGEAEKLAKRYGEQEPEKEAFFFGNTG